jgi:hypothetical protein
MILRDCVDFIRRPWGSRRRVFLKQKWQAEPSVLDSDGYRLALRPGLFTLVVDRAAPDSRLSLQSRLLS